jgi:hypothetical protein
VSALIAGPPAPHELAIIIIIIVLLNHHRPSDASLPEDSLLVPVLLLLVMILLVLLLLPMLAPLSHLLLFFFGLSVAAASARSRLGLASIHGDQYPGGAPDTRSARKGWLTSLGDPFPTAFARFPFPKNC